MLKKTLSSPALLESAPFKNNYLNNYIKLLSTISFPYKTMIVF